jgi:TRAP-type transport system periplasmic protein
MSMKTIVAAAAWIVSASLASAEPVQLKFAYPGPPQSRIFTDGVVPWSEEVNKAAEGAIEVKPNSGFTLASPVNVVDRVLNGVVELGFVLPGLYPQIYPRSMVVALPFETRTGAESAVAMWNIYANGAIAPEYAAVKPLAFAAFPSISFHSKKPVAQISDFKGLKISVDTRIMGQVVEALGAAPVTMPPSDIYQALQRGTIDASGIGWPGITPFKLNEVVSYHLDAPLCGAALAQIMNKDAYAKLPAKGREAIDRLGGLAFSQRMGRAVDAMDNDGRNATKGVPGQTISTLSPQAEAEWRRLLQPVTDAWIAATPDGAAVLAAYRAETAKQRAK